ncbi:MAG: DNA damage-inducible protein D [Candidatus Hydrogenedentes bacterium]|nr:DNA damage-inducible protein D [Candidatus Hydrogenedentota bacterium]
MKREKIVELHAEFEEIVRRDDDSDIEFWMARDLLPLLGYRTWRNFEPVVEKAVKACEMSGYPAEDHFARVRTMVNIGSGAQRDVDDIMLTRYACYLIAQNGDSTKAPVAFAQTYFAVQTRKQEVIEKRLAEVERLSARKKLTQSERELSGIIFERLRDGQSFARIRSKGDMALFGGNTTNDMKKRLGVSKGRALADFLPAITIKAKDFANEITNFNIKRDDLRTEPKITAEHTKNNKDVRKLLLDRKIVPENLPPSEDLKKIERRLTSEEKKLPKRTESFEPHDEKDAR